jgi:hypothetical protein
MVENRHVHLGEILEREMLKDKLEDFSRKESEGLLAGFGVNSSQSSHDTADLLESEHHFV